MRRSGLNGRFAVVLVRSLLVFIAVFGAVAADTKDPWEKVRSLKTGTDLRIIQAGAARPIMAKFAELTEDNLVVIAKNEQFAIPRNKIMRIDSRPQTGYVKTETKKTAPSDGAGAANKTVPGAAPSTSYSTGLAISDKTEFETIYRRAPDAAPHKK